MRLAEAAIARLREICLALPDRWKLPGAVEKETWETPAFRVRDKTIAMHAVDGRLGCGATRAGGASDPGDGGAGAVLPAALCRAPGVDRILAERRG